MCYAILNILLLCSVIFSVNASEEYTKLEDVLSGSKQVCGGCETQIQIINLCLEKLRAHCIDTDQLTSTNVCTDNVNTEQVSANKVCANNIVALTGCISRLNAIVCNNIRAMMVFSSAHTYSLGTPINWNVILDDPNGNVSLFPTMYTVPVSGYYVIMLQVDQENLQTPAGPILGTPIANPKLLVNGVIHRQNFTPFLSFLNLQKTTYTSIIKLKKGDKIQSAYDIVSQNDSLGVVNIAGTVDIRGNGTADNESIFAIHLIAADCNQDFACEPCASGECTPCCS